MPIQVNCPGCKTSLKIPDAHGGKKVKCPKCQSAMQVPNQAAAAPVSPVASDTLMVQCAGCQAKLKLNTSMAGKKVACPKCKTTMAVPPTSAPQAPVQQAPIQVTPVQVTPIPVTPAPVAPIQQNQQGVFGGAPGAPASNDPFGAMAGQPAPNPYAQQGPAVGGQMNPYSSPAPAGPGYARYPAGPPRSPVLYSVAGWILFVWCILAILSLFFQAYMIFDQINSGLVPWALVDKPVFFGRVTGMVVVLCIMIISSIGAFNMQRRERYGLACTTAVLMTIPCFGVIVFPVGIWACVLMFSEQGRRDFATKRR